jgi:hypothetical protein
MSETDSRFKDTTEVSTDCRTVRAAVEDPADKAFPAFSPGVECLHVYFILTGPSKHEWRAIFKHGCEIPAIDTQAMGGAPGIGVQTEERSAAVSLRETLADVLVKIYTSWFDREAKVIVDFDNWQCPPRDVDGTGDSVQGGCTADDDSAFFDVHGYVSPSAPFCQKFCKRAEAIEVSSQENAVIGIEQAPRDARRTSV